MDRTHQPCLGVFRPTGSGPFKAMTGTDVLAQFEEADRINVCIRTHTTGVAFLVHGEWDTVFRAQNMWAVQNARLRVHGPVFICNTIPACLRGLLRNID